MLLAAAALLVPAGTAAAARSLRASAMLTIEGTAGQVRAGSSVAGAGDVNGDGVPDVVVGAPGVKCRGGAAYVVFGARRRLVVRLSALRRHGFAIVGPAGVGGGGPPDCIGRQVGAAGDVNRDGLADVIVGAPGVTRSGVNSGAAYVVFGKRSTTSVNLGSLGAAGYAIEGAATTVEGLSTLAAGSGVASAGDVNGDGRPDALVSALEDAVSVVYGKADTAPVDLAALGSQGYTIAGDIVGPTTVAGIGDVNGDKRPDIGFRIDFGVDEGADGAFFLFGGPHSGIVSPHDPGAGFLTTGRYTGSFAGSALAGAGDINGDRLADVLVGAYGEGCRVCPNRPPEARREAAGAVYLVYGQRRGVSPQPQTRAKGIYFAGARKGGQLGESVAGIGDLNGDHVPDLALGAPGPSRDIVFHGSRTMPGSVFVVFGQRHMRSLDLARIGSHGFELRGQPRDRAGRSIDRAGDMNGDGHPDLVVGAPGADHARGAVYVVSLAR